MQACLTAWITRESYFNYFSTFVAFNRLALSITCNTKFNNSAMREMIILCRPSLFLSPITFFYYCFPSNVKTRTRLTENGQGRMASCRDWPGAKCSDEAESFSLMQLKDALTLNSFCTEPYYHTAHCTCELGSRKRAFL